MADSEFKNSSIYKEMMEIFMKLDNESESCSYNNGRGFKS